MALLKIYTYPDACLSQVAKPIAEIKPRHHTLASDMLETMYEAPGVGLAANQVGVLERIIVVDCEYEISEEEIDETTGPEQSTESQGAILYTNKNPLVLINPEIVAKEGRFEFTEGCLSVPEFQADVERFKKIKVIYRDLEGSKKELSAEGLLAVALQHEIDHLDGKLFIERLTELKQNQAKKKLIKERAIRDETGAPVIRARSRIRHQDREKP